MIPRQTTHAALTAYLRSQASTASHSSASAEGRDPLRIASLERHREVRTIVEVVAIVGYAYQRENTGSEGRHARAQLATHHEKVGNRTVVDIAPISNLIA